MGMRLAAVGPDRYRLSQNADINVTPFVDVMLVLLIIFMVAIPVATVSVRLELPRAEASELPTVPPTYVSLQADGHLFIGDAPTTLASLPGDLARRIGASNPRTERVYIRADRSVRYQAFMDVMNRLKGAGYERVGLVGEDLS